MALVKSENEPSDLLKEVFEQISTIKQDIQNWFEEKWTLEQGERKATELLIDLLISWRLQQESNAFFQLIHAPQFHIYPKNLPHIQTLLHRYSDNFDKLKVFLNEIPSFKSGDLLSRVFENFISEKSKKSSGTYYTPKNISRLVAQRTIKHWMLNEIRKRFTKHTSIESIEEFCEQSSEKERLWAEKRALNANFLDPSCGTGDFLLSGALSLNEIYFKLTTRKSKGERSRFNSFIAILTNAYGIDINAEAIRIVKIRIILKTLEQMKNLNNEIDERKLVSVLNDVMTTLEENIKAGNSLSEGVEKRFFPDLFSEKDKGFDIVLGNPPHGSKMKKKLKKHLSAKYGIKTRRVSQYFVLKSTELCNTRGVLALIIPKQFTYNDGWSEIRNHLMENHAVEEILDLGNSFSGQSNEHIALIWQKKSIGNSEKQKNQYFCTGIFSASKNMFIEENKVPIDFFHELGHFPLCLNEKEIELGRLVLENNPLRMDFVNGFRGIPAKYTTRDKNKWETPTYEKRDIKKYRLSPPGCGLKNKEKLNKKRQKMREPKVLAQRIVSFTTVPESTLKIKTLWDCVGLLTKSTVVNIFLNNDKLREKHPKASTKDLKQKRKRKSEFLEWDYPAIVALLNSRFVSWYVQRFIYTKHFETSKDLDVKYLQRLPFPSLDSSQWDILSRISVYMHVISEKIERKNAIPEMQQGNLTKYRSHFQKLIDCIVVEAYFREAFSKSLSVVSLLNKVKQLLDKIQPEPLQTIKTQFEIYITERWGKHCNRVDKINRYQRSKKTRDSNRILTEIGDFYEGIANQDILDLESQKRNWEEILGYKNLIES